MVHITQAENGIQQQAAYNSSKIEDKKLNETKTTTKNGVVLKNADYEIDFKVVDELRELLKDEYENNGGDQTFSSTHYKELMDSESPMTCWRYYIHENRKVKPTFDLMKAALVWRKQNRVDELCPERLVKEFWLKAPIGVVGKTRQGMDLVYCVGKNYRKPSNPEVKQLVRDFITYLIVDFDRKHKDDLEGFLAVFDVTDTTYSNLDLDFVSWLITIPDYFPTRFVKVYIIGIPFLIRPIIRLIISWLPERYKRICVCGTMEQVLEEQADCDNLPSEVKGSAPDTWRLAPIEAPWSADTTQHSEAALKKLNDSICFNTTEERLESLYKMQRDYEAKKLATSAQ